MRFGPDAGPVVVMALPLFEEANRTRTFAVTLLRALANHGVAGALPDLPGQGESLLPTQAARIGAMQAAFAGACERLAREGRSVHAAAIRSGALFDRTASVRSRWHFAPSGGPALLRDLGRIRQAAGTRAVEGGAWRHDAIGDHVEIAGNRIARAMLAELATCEPCDADDSDVALRSVRMESDPRPADRRVPGVPLWRRAEPGNDPALAGMLAQDLSQWIYACDG